MADLRYVRYIPHLSHIGLSGLENRPASGNTRSWLAFRAHGSCVQLDLTERPREIGSKANTTKGIFHVLVSAWIQDSTKLLYPGYRSRSREPSVHVVCEELPSGSVR